MMSVLQFGMSSPLSMIVVQTSTWYWPATKSVIIRSRPSAPIWPWPTPTVTPGSRSRRRAATELVLDRLDDQFFVVALDDSLDRQAVGRRRLDRAEVARAGESEVKGAG